ncbi:hypothetical protein [Yeosuana sp. AK3]
MGTRYKRAPAEVFFKIKLFIKKEVLESMNYLKILLKYIIYTLFLLTVNSYCQNYTYTKLARKGSLFDSIETNLRFTEFKKGQKCEVIEFVGVIYGNSLFKVRYKKWIGFVYLEDLVLNDEMKKMLDNYEQIKKKEVEDRKLESERKLEIIRQEIEFNKKEKEKKKIREQEIAKLERNKKDSILKVNDSLKIVDIKNNCHYLRNEIDQFDKIKILETEFYGVEFSTPLFPNLFIKLKKAGLISYVCFYLRENLGCSSPFNTSKSYVKVKLLNEDILTFFHIGDIDCSDEFTLIATISKEQISRLRKSSISSIRLSGTEYYKDIENIDYKEFFVDKLKCILN